MIHAIIVIILGILALSSLIGSRQAALKKLFSKIAPFNGWIGIAAIICGIWALYCVIISTKLLNHGANGILTWLTFLAIALIEITIGFIMGFDLIAKHALSKNPLSQAKARTLHLIAAAFQTKLGYAALIAGILFLLLSRS